MPATRKRQLKMPKGRKRGPINVRLTDEQRDIVATDLEAFTITRNWLIKRVRTIYRRPGLSRDEVEGVDEWYHMMVTRAARSWKSGKGMKWRSYLIQAARDCVPSLLDHLGRRRRKARSTDPAMLEQGDSRLAGSGFHFDEKKRHVKFSTALMVMPQEINDRELDLSVLTSEERDILMDRYAGSTAQQVGEKHGRDRAWCRRIEANALEKLGALK